MLVLRTVRFSHAFVLPSFSVIFSVTLLFFILLFSVVRQVVWTGVTRKSPENAWVAKVPTWPLTLVFLGQLAALAGGVYHVVRKGESSQARAQEAFVGRGWFGVIDGFPSVFYRRCRCLILTADCRVSVDLVSLHWIFIYFKVLTYVRSSIFERWLLHISNLT